MLQVLFTTYAEDAQFVGISGVPSVEALYVVRDLPIPSCNSSLLLQAFHVIELQLVQLFLLLQL